MRKVKVLFFMSSLLAALSGLGLAQSNADSHQVTMTVNDIALLAVIGGDITLTIGAPGTPGLPPGNATNSACRLQYTALVPTGQSRTITVEWDVAGAPSGTELRVTATPAGLGSGATEGSSAGSVVIAGLAAPVVTGIGSCYTGTGGTDGAQLDYVLAITDASSLVSGQTVSANVTYTLTDAS